VTIVVQGAVRVGTGDGPSAQRPLPSKRGPGADAGGSG